MSNIFFCVLIFIALVNIAILPSNTDKKNILITKFFVIPLAIIVILIYL